MNSQPPEGKEEKLNPLWEIWKQDKVPDLTDMTPEQKAGMVTGLIEVMAKETLKVFMALGLKTHIESKVINEPTGEEFQFSFTKLPTPPATVIQHDCYPGKDYQRLFNVINESAPNPLLSQMQDIIRVVHEDFPTPPNQLSGEISIEMPEHGKIVLTNSKGDTYTSKSEELIDFLFGYKKIKVSNQLSGIEVDGLREIIAGILYANKSDEGDEGSWINSEDFYKVTDKIITAISFKAGYAASEGQRGWTITKVSEGEEAIKMIKWIREEYEPEFENGRHWVDILDDNDPPTPITDAELYNLYKLSKK